MDFSCNGYGIMTPSAFKKLIFMTKFRLPLGKKTRGNKQLTGDLFRVTDWNHFCHVWVDAALRQTGQKLDGTVAAALTLIPHGNAWHNLKITISKKFKQHKVRKRFKSKLRVTLSIIKPATLLFQHFELHTDYVSQLVFSLKCLTISTCFRAHKKRRMTDMFFIGRFVLMSTFM